ncbi:Flp pilus assembly protein TadG [Schumannella luteola]|uniref:Flp pilus assembly protein TadG n=1 Tax=Schumannella luteola TaxID=472059 RepID=A0A852YAP2_9MICO|nr:hypothetical protein [Schumannella luteola]NYG99583.1 Flp pilus assembly protein TadG [Schumannella luteola]
MRRSSSSDLGMLVPGLLAPRTLEPRATRRRARRRQVALRDERGSATLEFLTAGMLLLIPLVYLVIALAQLQAGAFAAEGAARQAARVYVRADTVEDARSAAERAVRVGLADYGIDPATASVRVTCDPDPDDCLTRGGEVAVALELVVPLPLVPTALDADVPAGVPMRASATQPVSRFHGAGG